MIRALYQATSAMMAQMARQISISANLSNVSTPGYKEDKLAIEDFREMYLHRIAGDDIRGIGSLSTAVRLDATSVNFEQGSLIETGNSLDLALAGDGFFTIETPAGLQYTRDGSFHLDATRQLVTSDGMPVLGENGPIAVPQGDVWVDVDGTVRVGDQIIDRLRLTAFEDVATLRSMENNRFEAEGDGVPAETAGVSQGFLEQANVDQTQAMVDMLAANRSYALANRMLQVADQSLGLAVNEIGKVG